LLRPERLPRVMSHTSPVCTPQAASEGRSHLGSPILEDRSQIGAARKSCERCMGVYGYGPLEDALVLEYRAMMHVMEGYDFFEGVRSVLIDRDQKPRLHYSSLGDVGTAEVDRHFEGLGDDELSWN